MLHTKFCEYQSTGVNCFYYIWVWLPGWSYDPDAVNKLPFPLPKEAPHNNLAVIGQTVFEKMFDIMNKWTDAGACVNYELT